MNYSNVKQHLKPKHHWIQVRQNQNLEQQLYYLQVKDIEIRLIIYEHQYKITIFLPEVFAAVHIEYFEYQNLTHNQIKEKALKYSIEFLNSFKNSLITHIDIINNELSAD